MLSKLLHEPKRAYFSFKPDFVAKSVRDIDFDFLKEHGIKYCLVDLDDTVVERGKFIVDPLVTDVLKRSELNIYIATNRPKSRDLKDLKDLLGAQGVVHPHGLYGKPTKHYFLNALKDKGLDRSRTVMIGDRIIQDIFGANRAGIYSLLVHKLGRPKGSLDALFSKIEKAWINYISNEYRSK